MGDDLMPATTAPDTEAIGLAIVSYLAALTYPDTTLVYKLAQLDVIGDVVGQITDGGVVVEVYAEQDGSERRGFGGRIWDTQKWAIVSMCSKETPVLSRQIYKARDALVQPFQTHAQLGNIVSNLFHSQLDPMNFAFIPRNGQFVRAHKAVLLTKQEWIVATPPGVIS